MSKREGITLTSLDLLLLAILKQAPGTNYFFLQQQCGLPIGVAHPALARLSKRNLVEVKPTKEGKARSISLTRRGQAALEASWRMCLRAASTPESMIRAVTLAALLGDADDKRLAVRAAREAAARRRSAAAKRRIDLEDFNRRRNTPLGLHLWMTARLDMATWEAEAAVLEEIANELEGAGQQLVSSDTQTPKTEPETIDIDAIMAEQRRARRLIDLEERTF